MSQDTNTPRPTPKAKPKNTKRYAVLKFRGKSKGNGRLVVTGFNDRVTILQADGETIECVVMVKFVDGPKHSPAFGVRDKNLEWCKVGR